MPRPIVFLVLSALLAAEAAGAAGMKLERERLFTMDGPETVGFEKVRFDFQHNFKDYTLNPSVDLALAFGVWDNVQIQAETLLHNLESTTFGKTTTFQYDSVDWSAKWAVLDQTRDDWFSLGVGATFGRTDTESKFLDPAAGVHQLQRDHNLGVGASAVAHYDTTYVSQYVSVQYEQYESKALSTYLKEPKVFSTVSPGLGERIKLYETKNVKLHAVGEYETGIFKTYNDFVKRRAALHAWAAGVQCMVGSPHIFSFFVSNTFGNTLPDNLFGGLDTFYNFRWSYRF